MYTYFRADIESFLLSDEKELLIDKCNGFQRKLVYELIDEKYLNKVSTSSKNLENNRKGILIVRKRTMEEELELNDLKIKEEEEKINNIVGISLLMKEISSSVSYKYKMNDTLYLLFVFIEKADDWTQYAVGCIVHGKAIF